MNEICFKNVRYLQSTVSNLLDQLEEKLIFPKIQLRIKRKNIVLQYTFWQTYLVSRFWPSHTTKFIWNNPGKINRRINRGPFRRRRCYRSVINFTVHRTLAVGVRRCGPHWHYGGGRCLLTVWRNITPSVSLGKSTRCHSAACSSSINSPKNFDYFFKSLRSKKYNLMGHFLIFF